jgi:hypothetical protein
MFHNDAKVLERLEKIETSHESTKHLLVEIFKMLKSFDMPRQLVEESGNSGPNLSRNNSISNQDEPCSVEAEGKHVHFEQCESDPSCAAVESEENCGQSVDNSISNQVWKDSNFVNSDRTCFFVHRDRVTIGGATEIGGTQNRNRAAGLDIIQLSTSNSNPESKSHSESITCEPMTAVQNSMSTFHDTFGKKAGCPVGIKACMMGQDQRASDTSEDSVWNMISGHNSGPISGEQIQQAATARRPCLMEVTHKVGPSVASPYCPKKVLQSTQVNKDDHQLPVGQTHTAIPNLAALALPSHDRDNETGLVAQLVHSSLKVSSDST